MPSLFCVLSFMNDIIMSILEFVLSIVLAISGCTNLEAQTQEAQIGQKGQIRCYDCGQ